MTTPVFVNGHRHCLKTDPAVALIYALRNELGLKSPKPGCNLEQCGACKVLVDDTAQYSCLKALGEFHNRRITTLEGLATNPYWQRLRQTFSDERAAQCGYCIPGIMVAATALLQSNPNPGSRDIRRALEDHLCRCGSQARIVRAIHRAAGADSR